jgi:YbgC/YbaW family acyl-CoA thioester hydrolase
MEFEYKVRIRSYDTDWQGVVNFGRYARLVSEALEQLYINLFGQDAPIFGNTIIVTRRWEIDYLKPLIAGEEVNVRISIGKNGPHSLKASFMIYNQKGELCAEGSKILVFVDRSNWKKVEIPKEVERLFQG